MMGAKKMKNKIRVAILGYGNIGKAALQALKETPDMEIVGVVNKDILNHKPLELENITVVKNIKELQNVQVALLCIPSRVVPEVEKEILAMGINTVDCYDIHGELANLRKDLKPIAQASEAVAIISAGWDPGTDSMLRCMFEFMAPRGITYTNFGPGMSMGHSVAVKAFPGVSDALAITIPKGTGIHRRMVYVELDKSVEFSKIEAMIKNDPYFVHDETFVFAVDNVDNLKDVGHGVAMERKGVSGITHNQLLKFDMRINNPALTAQIMVSAARATLLQAPGAYTMIEVPIIDYIYGDRENLIAKLV
jgi:diaminopimelate dehydrogenase